MMRGMRKRIPASPCANDAHSHPAALTCPTGNMLRMHIPQHLRCWTQPQAADLPPWPCIFAASRARRLADAALQVQAHLKLAQQATNTKLAQQHGRRWIGGAHSHCRLNTPCPWQTHELANSASNALPDSRSDADQHSEPAAKLCNVMRSQCTL